MDDKDHLTSTADAPMDIEKVIDTTDEVKTNLDDKAQPNSTVDPPMDTDEIDSKHAADNTLTNQLNIAPIDEIPNDRESLNIGQDEPFSESMIENMNIDTLIANIKEAFNEIPLSLEHGHSDNTNYDTQSEPLVMTSIIESEAKKKSLETCKTGTSQNIDDNNLRPASGCNEENEPVSSDMKEKNNAEHTNVDFECNINLEPSNVSSVCVEEETSEYKNQTSCSNVDSDTLNSNKLAEKEVEKNSKSLNKKEEENNMRENNDKNNYLENLSAEKQNDSSEHEPKKNDSDKTPIRTNILTDTVQEDVLAPDNRPDIKDLEKIVERVDNVNSELINNEPKMNVEYESNTGYYKNVDIIENLDKTIDTDVQSVPAQSSGQKILEENVLLTNLQKEIKENDSKTLLETPMKDVRENSELVMKVPGNVNTNIISYNDSSKPTQTSELENVEENVLSAIIKKKVEDDEELKDVTEIPKLETLCKTFNKETPCYSIQTSEITPVLETVNQSTSEQHKISIIPESIDNVQPPQMVHIQNAKGDMEVPENIDKTISNSNTSKPAGTQGQENIERKADNDDDMKGITETPKLPTEIKLGETFNNETPCDNIETLKITSIQDSVNQSALEQPQKEVSEVNKNIENDRAPQMTLKQNANEDVEVSENTDQIMGSNNSLKPAQTLKEGNTEKMVENDEDIKDFVETSKSDTGIEPSESVNKETPCDNIQVSNTVPVQKTVQVSKNIENVQPPQTTPKQNSEDIKAKSKEINKTDSDNSEQQTAVNNEISPPTSELFKCHTVPDMKKNVNTHVTTTTDSTSVPLQTQKNIPASLVVQKDTEIPDKNKSLKVGCNPNSAHAIPLKTFPVKDNTVKPNSSKQTVQKPKLTPSKPSNENVCFNKNSAHSVALRAVTMVDCPVPAKRACIEPKTQEKPVSTETNKKSATIAPVSAPGPPVHNRSTVSFLTWGKKYGFFTEEDILWPFSSRLKEILSSFNNNNGVLKLSPVPKAWKHRDIYHLLRNHAATAGKDANKCLQCIYFDESDPKFNTVYIQFRPHNRKFYFIRVMLALQKAKVAPEGNTINVEPDDGSFLGWTPESKPHLISKKPTTAKTTAKSNDLHSSGETSVQKTATSEEATNAEVETSDVDSADETSERVTLVLSVRKPASNIKPFIDTLDYKDKEMFGLNPAFLENLDIQLPLSCEIKAKNLPREMNETSVREIFSYAGNIVRVQTHLNPRCVNAKIQYDHPVEAVQAVSMFNMRELHGRPMIVHLSRYCAEKFPAGRIPKGMTSIGRGLGRNGIPLKSVRISMEVGILRKKLDIERLKLGNKVSVIQQLVNELQTKFDRQEITAKTGTDAVGTSNALATVIANTLQSNILGLLSAQPNQLLQGALGLQQNDATNPNRSASGGNLNWVTNSQPNTSTQSGPNVRHTTNTQQPGPSNMQPTFSNAQLIQQTIEPLPNFPHVQQYSAYTAQQQNQAMAVQYGYQNQGYAQSGFNNVHAPTNHQPVPMPQYANPGVALQTNSSQDHSLARPSRFDMVVPPPAVAKPQSLNPQPPLPPIPTVKFVPQTNEQVMFNAPRPVPKPNVKSRFDIGPGFSNILPVPAPVAAPKVAEKPSQNVAKPPEVKKPQNRGQFIPSFQTVKAPDESSIALPAATKPQSREVKPAYGRCSRSPSPDPRPSRNKSPAGDTLSRRSKDNSISRYYDERRSEERRRDSRERDRRRDSEERDRKRYRGRDGRNSEERDMKRYKGSERIRDSGERDEKRSRQLKEVQKKEDNDETLIISHLPNSVSTEDLKEKMREIGRIAFAEMKSDGRGVVRFRHRSDAEKCIQMYHKAKVDNQTIEVKWKY